MKTLFLNLVDLHQRRIYPASISIAEGKITDIKSLDSPCAHYALPGFVDAHIHIESSMLTPRAFAAMAVRHGTVATVSDPHEIANVLGLKGVLYMIENGRHSDFKFYFGAPSCVPATNFENAGAALGLDALEQLLLMPEVKYLAEMMNYPGVLHQDPEVMAKIALAQRLGKPIDGHAPGLRGQAARDYIAAGMSTDHECFTAEEALDKLQAGMHVLIREGSAAKNFEALAPLLPQYFGQMMFCSDDKHPDELLLGHINQLVQRALAKGFALFDVLEVACLNPVKHYGLDLGLLRVGDPADFIVVEDLTAFKVLKTYIGGKEVFDGVQDHIPQLSGSLPNHFEALPRQESDFRLSAKDYAHNMAIEAIDGELITRKVAVALSSDAEGFLQADPAQDLLKIAVINRYVPQARPAIAFIKNFGLKEGAIASTVAHDSHNIIVVGADDAAITEAVNLLIAAQGGVVAVGKGQQKVLSLPIAGLMSPQSAEEVAAAYTEIDAFAKELGSTLKAPFMTLSFMALLVIPHIKISDLGLFDADDFRFF
jgi:adenine deaminase